MTALPVGPHDAIGASAAGHACYDRATALTPLKLRFFKFLRLAPALLHRSRTHL
jgi:hypothetical protein